jgi:glyoxylase I family protein
VEKVVGFGSVFFRARDPKALARWYEQHLGITPAPENYDQLPWWNEAGPSGYAPFRDDTEYFGDPGKQWMVNFRVRDLDTMGEQLRSAGIAVEVDPREYPNGRFARIHDPEGNPIELWQPMVRDAPGSTNAIAKSSSLKRRGPTAVVMIHLKPEQKRAVESMKKAMETMTPEQRAAILELLKRQAAR